MKKSTLARVTGGLFIAGAILVNIPYMILVMNFDYPDILREAPGIILTRFAQGGPGLIWTWLSFAWVGAPILLGIILLPRVLERPNQRSNSADLAKAGMYFGVIGAVAQIIGLLRWPFVVPALAASYAGGPVSPATQVALESVFQAVHQYGGVVLGEHIGQTFTIIWMVLTSASMLGKEDIRRWIPLSGFFASAIYFLAQGELLATVIPGFPHWANAGLIGSLLWLGWMIALGVTIITKERGKHEYTREDPGFGVSVVQ
jgi:hypothetical protein